MTYNQIMQAVLHDGEADELFGISQIPRVPDGSVMLVYFIEPETLAFKMIEQEADSPEGFWFVVHVHGQGMCDREVCWIIYTKKGKNVKLSFPIYRVMGIIKDDNQWFLVRYLTVGNTPFYTRQRSLT